MSRTSAAFLSFNSSGTIGDALTASHWKGISYLRKYARPSNPNTQPQIDNRALMTNLVARWRHNITKIGTGGSWNRLSTHLKLQMSGYNVFCRESMAAIQLDPTSCVSLNCEAIGAHKVMFLMMALADGGYPAEHGYFDIMVGDAPSNITVTQQAVIEPTGFIIPSTPLGETGQRKYVACRRTGTWRSGIYEITLL